MKVLLCDFVGHAFPTELSRVLAARGHRVLHAHLAGFVVGKGPLERQPDDPTSLDFLAVDLGSEFPKYHPVKRVVHELRFAARLVRQMRRQRPDVVLLSTTPPIAQLAIALGGRVLRVPVVVWLQDLFGAAVASGGKAAAGRFAGPIASGVSWIERVSLRRASHVVAISHGFMPFLKAARVPAEKVTVIPNWAALSSLAPRAKANPWSDRHGLAHTPVVLYAGTLGFKHDWTLLLDLARALADRPPATLVVVSEGTFVDRLRDAANAEHLDSLVILPFQPFDALPDVLATADVCLALLTDDAAQFSVPSKVQSYMAAGRPVLIGGPASGDAAHAVVDSGAGLVVDPDDRNALVQSAVELLDHPGDCGERARAYAVAEFDVERKADQFEQILELLAPTTSAPSR